MKTFWTPDRKLAVLLRYQCFRMNLRSEAYKFGQNPFFYVLQNKYYWFFCGVMWALILID
jgi:hypothetical protein